MLRAALAAITVIVVLAVPGAAAAQSDPASVFVVHGVPGTPVDVYANGDVIIEDFQPLTIGGPLSLPAGEYALAIRPAGSGASADPLASATATVEAGQSVSVVAHLTPDGDPVITPYVNNRSDVPAGQARVTVRHDAAAPAVDVRAGDDVLVEDLSSPDARTIEASPGTIEVALAPTGESDIVTGPTPLTLAAGGSYAVYAVGSVEEDTDQFIVQPINAGAGAPGGVPGGNSGLLGGDDGPGTPALALLVVGLIGGVASLLVLRRRPGAGGPA